MQQFNFSITRKTETHFRHFSEVGGRCFSALRHRTNLLLVMLVFLATACGGGGGGDSGGGQSKLAVSNYTAFSKPELVLIKGYGGDIMEPFISRNGNYLFFNDNGRKNIFYATYVNDTTFQYAGPINAINTSAVEGAPTMDATNKFYYVSTARYNRPPGTHDTLYSGTWNGKTVTGSAVLSGLASTESGFIDFDLAVSPDGSTIYFSEGDFGSGNNFPSADEIVVAVKSGSGFTRLPNSSTIMANVNTADLEYAPAISADGRELFFTRLDLSSMTTGIYRAARANTGSPFDAPQLVSAIAGFVEGPALSPDEKSLYYHRQNTDTGVFELYRVTRP